MEDLKIALDLDDTVLDFRGSYVKKFGNPKTDQEISKNVFTLRNNSIFWSNLPLLEKPNFEPVIYATKRINNKLFTKKSLLKNGLPIKPIYQTLCQKSNKADIIKGRCDVLIDDSIFNVLSCIKAGVPALLIDRDHNKHVDFKYRIYHLDKEEIRRAYNLLIKEWK